MAPPLFTKVLAGITGPEAPGNFGSFSPPEGYRWIIKDFHVEQPAPGEETAGIWQAVVESAGNYIAAFLFPPGTNSNLYTESGRTAVVMEGDTLYFYQSVGFTTVRACGYELAVD